MVMKEQHIACPCGQSSDGYCEYDDGGYCFVCHKNFGDHKHVSDEGTTRQYIARKNITQFTHRFYKAETVVSSDGVPLEVHYPYAEGFKIRKLDEKKFTSSGNMKGGELFGKSLFSSGSAKSITITEGEDDAMAVYQMMGSKYPAVSVKSASTAARDCAAELKYLNSFDQIYLCFDNDVPGQEAVKEVARLFDVNKVYHVDMDKFKDAGEYLANNQVKEFVSKWYNSKKYLPKGIVSGTGHITEILNSKDSEAVATYPFPTLNDMTYGIRLGELNLFTAKEKIGKTEVMRAIEYHLLKTTDENVGIIHLEEQEKRSVQGLIGYELEQPIHLPDSSVTIEEQVKGYEALTQDRPDRLFFYSHFGSDDPDTILDTIRYLVSVCDCKFIFLDHITMVVTGHKDDGDERRKLDYISTKLAEMTRELDFTLFLVSHVNDDGQTRGSRNISKVADLIVSLDRDLEAESVLDRNKTRVTVKGNRFGGTSGPANALWFDNNTHTMQEVTKEIEVANQTMESPF